MLKKRSVFNRILIPLIIVQIFQISLFGMLVFSGGVITKLDRNAEEILNERVINRKNYLENEMIQRWSCLLYTYESIKIRQEFPPSAAALSNEVFSSFSPLSFIIKHQAEKDRGGGLFSPSLISYE